MPLETGWEDTVVCPEGNIKTIGDIQYGSQQTEIEVKTRASLNIRYLQGMTNKPISLTVIAGVDPEDPNGVNGYEFFKSMHDGRVTNALTIGNVSGNFVCTKFETAAPVDGLKTANVDLRLSAKNVSSGS